MCCSSWSKRIAMSVLKLSSLLRKTQPLHLSEVVGRIVIPWRMCAFQGKSCVDSCQCVLQLPKHSARSFSARPKTRLSRSRTQETETVRQCFGCTYRNCWFGWWIASFGVLGLRSHSRPHQVPASQRERMLNRPEATYNAKTGRNPGCKELRRSKGFFLLTPTDPKRSTLERRSPHSGKLRFQIKKCASAKQLLSLLHASTQAGGADISMVSAAAQRCGQRRWWDALTDVLSFQQEHQIASDSVHISAVLHALSTCLRRNGEFGVVPDRAQMALKLGQRLVSQGQDKITNAHDFNTLLSSAFKLCAAAGLKVGHKWALELWEWSSGQDFVKNEPTWASFLALAERLGYLQLVDKLLRQGRQEGAPWLRNFVALGGLLNSAADRCDAARADVIWNKFCAAGTKPNMICYSTYAKAHMLAGTPRRAIDILDEMESSKVAAMNAIIAVHYGQCLLVVCHSTPSATNMKRLKAFLARGDRIVSDERRGNTVAEWKCIKDKSYQLLSGEVTLCLRDVLTEWKTRNSNAMKSWPNFAQGAGYLEGMQKFLGQNARSTASCQVLGHTTPIFRYLELWRTHIIPVSIPLFHSLSQLILQTQN